MFEPSWFIAGNVAVFRTNGFEDTLIDVTYAEAEGGVCELVVMIDDANTTNRNDRIMRPTSTFLFISILRSAIWQKSLHSCLLKPPWF
jgi:hypothetical protein